MAGAPVPRVDPLPESVWTDRHRQLAARLADGGLLDPVFTTLLHVPEMAEAVMPMTSYITSGSTLIPSHRVLVGLHTAWLDRSESVWAAQAVRAVRLELDVTG